MPEDIQQPVANLDAGSIRVRIYPRTNTKTGRPFYVTLAYRRYKDKASGEWKTGRSYTADELGVFIRRLEQAHQMMLDLQQADRVKARQSHPEKAAQAA